MMRTERKINGASSPSRNLGMKCVRKRERQGERERETELKSAKGKALVGNTEYRE
jgi:hypothetical protein